MQIFHLLEEFAEKQKLTIDCHVKSVFGAKGPFLPYGIAN